MIEKIAASLYRVEVPLPHNPLISVNSYFIKSRNRNLIIDTGLNLPECKEALISATMKLNIDLERTDFYITHLHLDHLELAPYLATKTSKIYLNEKEATILNHPIGKEAYRSFYLKYGFPENHMQEMEQNHMIQGYRTGDFSIDFVKVNENDILQTGDYSFRCIETPGHSPSHTCLYEPNKKILISGDHILFDITPNITSFPVLENALKEYLINLKKIYSLDITLILPGHRSIGYDHRKRIQEIKDHHKKRAHEILLALGKAEKTAYQTAQTITWDVSYNSWEHFPTPQKFFAFGEVIAHLKYLEGEGAVGSRMRNGQVYFSRV